MTPRSVSVSLLLALVAVILPATPTFADGASATAGDLTFPNAACRSTQVSVTGLDPVGSWVVTAVSPNGVPLQGTGTVSPGAGAVAFAATLCPRLSDGSTPYRAGTYAVQARDARTQAVSTVGSFHVSFPRLVVARAAEAGKRFATLKLNGQVLEHRRLIIELYYGGKWYPIAHRRTHGGGHVWVSCKKHAPCHYTLRFSYQDYVHSKRFRLTR